MIMKYFVYLLESLLDKSYYIGVTNDIQRRFKEHNTGKSKYTKTKVPWKLIAYKEFDDIRKAYSIEKKLKRSKKREYIKKYFNILN